MKRIISVALCLAFLFVFATSTFAKDNEKNKSDIGSITLNKIEASEKLKDDGEIYKIDKEMKEYYTNNEKYLVDMAKLKNPDSLEAKEVLEKIEKSMMNVNSDTFENSTTVGTRDLGGGDATGTNNISFSLFENGDIVLVHDGFCVYGYYRHAGTYDATKGEFVSAQISDQGYGDGVIWEPKSFYTSTYDEAVGVAVDYYESNRQTVLSNVMSFLRAQLGEPYSLVPGYNVRDKWYCSKLPWVGWKEKSGIDISGADWIIGMCLPDDIYYDGDTFVFATGN